MNYFTKESLKDRLREIRALGWVETRRKGNDGGVGNTLEDLLGIEENNLPLPNAGEWEIKGQRADTAQGNRILLTEDCSEVISIPTCSLTLGGDATF